MESRVGPETSLDRESIAYPCYGFPKTTVIQIDIHDFWMSVFNSPYKCGYPHDIQAGISVQGHSTIDIRKTLKSMAIYPYFMDSLQLSMFYGCPFGYLWIYIDIHAWTCRGFSFQGSAQMFLLLQLSHPYFAISVGVVFRDALQRYLFCDFLLDGHARNLSVCTPSVPNQSTLLRNESEKSTYHETTLACLATGRVVICVTQTCRPNCILWKGGKKLFRPWGTWVS